MREEKVQAKGKGEMQTFWLSPKGGGDRHAFGTGSVGGEKRLDNGGEKRLDNGGEKRLDKKQIRNGTTKIYFDEYVMYAEKNRAEWALKGKGVVEDYLKNGTTS
jgi:hypothetical protein